METKSYLGTVKQTEGNPQGKRISLIHLLNEDFLRVCFQRLKRDAATGVDGVTVKEYEANLEDNIKDLVARMKAWKYRPQSVRRVYIPKADGSKRPLGIPAVEDKIVQMGIKKILEEIFEDEFLDVSYGFRPNRNCHDALDALDKCIMRKSVNYVVDMDVEKFFDTVDHKWLMVALKQKISDRNFLRLIGRFLKAGVMEEGRYIEVDKGTPQGGIISPLLANIYLHYILDKWFEKKVKTQQKGYAQLIRYADDFVVCFQSGKEAQEFSEALRKRLWQKVKATNQWLKKVRNLLPLNEWWKILGVKLIGHYRYYGISGNLQALRMFYADASKLAYKWINRRSQRKSFTYSQYCKFKEHNPLPEPKIYHLTYTLSAFRGSITEEPCVGNLQARFCEGR